MRYPDNGDYSKVENQMWDWLFEEVGDWEYYDVTSENHRKGEKLWEIITDHDWW